MGVRRVVADGEWYEAEAPIKAASGVTLMGGAEIVNIAPNTAENGLLELGSFDRATMHGAEYFGLQATADRTSVVTLDDSADADAFGVGDLVFIRGGAFVALQDEYIYEYGMPNQVVGKADGSLALRYMVDQAVAENFAICAAPQMVADVGINGLRMRADAGAKMLRQGGGAVGCDISLATLRADSAMFTNAWAYCRVSIGEVRFDRHLWELATNSRHNIANIHYAEIMTAGVAGKRPIRLSENSCFNELCVGVLNLQRYVQADVPVYLSAGSDNRMVFGEMHAPNAQLEMIKFSNQLGMPLRRNVVSVPVKAIGGAAPRYVSWSDTGGSDQNEIRNSRFYGAVSSGHGLVMDGARPTARGVWMQHGDVQVLAGATGWRLVDVHAPNGVLGDIAANPEARGVTSDSFLAAAAQGGERVGDVGATVSSSAEKEWQTASYAAGQLKAGDRIDCGYVVATGGAGEKRVEIQVGADEGSLATLKTIVVPAAVGPEPVGCDIGVTVAVDQTRCMIVCVVDGGATEFFDAPVGVSGLALRVRAWRVDESGWMTMIAGRIGISRAGYGR